MTNALNGPIRDASVVTLSLLAWQFGGSSAQANPTGGTVAQGSATFHATGSQLTINTSANSVINWQSFNIGAGETTTFVEPSRTSVVWNHINDANPSQILGNLNANGIVILQNQNGFYIGGAASLKTGGLVMTTAPGAPNLSSGGAWDFNALPPTVPIINYGQITTVGGPAFLIADNIQNYGTISAEQGKIGLYAGQQVLVSTSPDGRGLNAKVSLPQGSVDNEGRLIADGGAIVAQAKTVNNNGLVQANTVQNVNGTIELLAGDSANLGANSIISSQGDSTSASSGGSVTVKSDNSFSDQAGSTISVAGGAQGGNGGQVEISAPQMNSLQSAISGQATTGYVDGALTIDPANVWLSSSATDPNAPKGYTVIPVNSFSGVSINVLADNNITLNTLWTLADSPSPAALTLSAGNNIALNDGSGIAAGNNWSVSLLAGTAHTGATAPAAGNDGIYFNGSAFVQTQNGSLSLWAANEVLLDAGGGAGNIGTSSGNNVSLTAEFGNIELGVPLTLNDSANPAMLTLQAGNSIILDGASADGTISAASISAGNNWNVNLLAGTAYTGVTAPAPAGGDGSYNYGVYLNDGANVQTQNGDINVSAANEVIIHTVDLSTGATSGAIRTMAGGNLSVTAEYGDVNAGNNIRGYDFNPASTQYAVDPNLGGISTAAGGNVSIHAGQDVISYLPTQGDYNGYIAANNLDQGGAGTGAFGPQPGNVTITAGGSVYGNYMVANGVGTIKAGGNAGTSVSLIDLDADFALSLIKGSWSVSAQNIYLDDVLNPNGVFNDGGPSLAGTHVFDYAANASVSLNAANAVEITGAEVPLLPASDVTTHGLPVLLPPTLQIVAGAGGLTLDTDVILFPSALGNLNITTLDGGNFESRQNPSDPVDLNFFDFVMSDSAQHQWKHPGTAATETFGYNDQAATPLEVNNPNPVQISISGSMNEVNLYATKATELTVGGNMFDSDFIGQNLHASDVTSVQVAGKISYSPVYTFVTLSQPLSSDWSDLFGELVDPNLLLAPIPPADINNPGKLKTDAAADLLFPANSPNPGFVYNQATQQLGYSYQMTSFVRGALEGNLETIALDSGGNPEYQAESTTVNGQKVTQYYFVTTPVSFVSTPVIETLYNGSLASEKSFGDPFLPGLQIGGPGRLNVTAGSMDLGASSGILSWGSGNAINYAAGENYGSLSKITPFQSGASVDVTVTGDLGMLTSAIASIDGGSVSVNSLQGEIDLGVASIPFSPAGNNLANGIYTCGTGDVNVTAYGSINIDTARIASFNGGDIFVESQNGDVNAGNGVNLDLRIPDYIIGPKSGFSTVDILNPRPFGSGILAITPTAEYQASGGELPGDITVETPNGDIVSTLGGISQFALDNNIGAGPSVSLVAGTMGVPASPTEGNIDLGQGGVLGGTVILDATGTIKGLIVSRQNTTITAVQSVTATVLAGGTANVSSSEGNVSGTLIGGTGVSVSGLEVTATVLSSSVSANGAAATSTLGVATASAASQSAANQSGNNAKQELANADTNPDDDRKRKNHPLMQRVKRVTVLLPKT